MQTYQYKARDKFGKPISGSINADSQDAVAVKLKESGYVIISIKEQEKETPVAKVFARFRRIGFTELNMFTRQFYTLQKAGLTILSSLIALRDQTTNRAFKDVITQIAKDIEGGLTLSGALEKHPQIFSPIYINMIRSGETSGTLDGMLERLAVLGEHEEEIRIKIKAATRYPIIVVCSIIIGFLVLTTLVIPRFAKIYAQFTTKLPLPTQILLTIYYVLKNYWWLLIILVAASIFFFRKLINTKEGRFWWDGLKLKIPIFGPLMLKLYMSRFSRLTGILMHSGVPLLHIFDLTSAGVGNKILSQTLDNIKMSVNEGKGMSGPMKVSGVFPPIVVQMVSVGEQTGKVDELLLHVSDYYDSEINYTINNLASLIEPILIFVLGCGVLFMALGIFLPMWNLMNLFKK